MTQMFEDHALFHTVRNRVGCSYGVKGGSIAFGWVPEETEGRDYGIDDIPSALSGHLEEIGLTLASLPVEVQDCALTATGYTLVKGCGPKFYGRRLPVQSLLDALLDHPQMARAMQICDIYVVGDGAAGNSGRPLQLPDIAPIEGHESPLVRSMPDHLLDPQSGHSVPTRAGPDPDGTLTIYTSEKSMTRGRRNPRRNRHTVNYRTGQGYIGSATMQSLGVQSTFVDQMYCTCELDELDAYKTNQRGPLVPSPLTRAVEHWIAGQVRDYCRQFESHERRRIRQEDQEEVSKLNEWLDKWKNEYLQEFMHHLYGPGPTPPPIPPLPTGVPGSIQISITHSRAGVGVLFRPSVRFLDDEGRRIRPVPFRWVSEDNNVAMVDEELNCVNTFAEGKTLISAESLDGRLRSNEVLLEVMRINKIRVVPSEIEIPVGSKRKVEAVCTLPNGEEIGGVYLTWMEDDAAVARVSSSGQVFGFDVGTTRVTATDDRCRDDSPAVVKVVSAEGPPDSPGRSGYPMILLSGIDCSPEEEEPAVFQADEPPIRQRPIDTERNVWWINMSSPFAQLYFSEEKGFGPRSLAWRMYHVERILDIMVQIALTQSPDSSEDQDSAGWIDTSSEFEARFRQDAVDDLGHLIETGILEA